MPPDELLFEPIPFEIPSVVGWKEVPIRESHDQLVPLGLFSDYHDIFTSSMYYGEHGNSPYQRDEDRLDGSLITMFVRSEVAEQLHRAQRLLPQGYHLIVLDGYRPLEVQQTLYDRHLGGLREKYPDWNDEQLSAETQKYVSIPSRDGNRPSPHSTGGAVDVAIYRLLPEIDRRIKDIDERLAILTLHAPLGLTPPEEAMSPVLRERYMLEMTKTGLIREHAQFLDFGTKFDHGGAEAALNYLEVLQYERALTSAEIEARDNRRLLYNVMLAVGMQPYAHEWWHYNAATSQMGARVAANQAAQYGGVTLSDGHLQHETIRQTHHSRLRRHRMTDGQVLF